jgi:hypothetical protein
MQYGSLRGFLEGERALWVELGMLLVWRRGELVACGGGNGKSERSLMSTESDASGSGSILVVDSVTVRAMQLSAVVRVVVVAAEGLPTLSALSLSLPLAESM